MQKKFLGNSPLHQAVIPRFTPQIGLEFLWGRKTVAKQKSCCCLGWNLTSWCSWNYQSPQTMNYCNRQNWQNCSLSTCYNQVCVPAVVKQECPTWSLDQKKGKKKKVNKIIKKFYKHTQSGCLQKLISGIQSCPVAGPASWGPKAANTWT